MRNRTALSLVAVSGSVSVSVTPGVAVLRFAAGLPGVLARFPAGMAAILLPDGVFRGGAASSRITWICSGQEDQSAQEVEVRATRTSPI